jgi:carbamoyltransferase
MGSEKSGWIAAITRGHNAGICLIKDGEIVFAIEEERLSRHKYDGGPLASMIKILDYTDTIDYLVIAHTQNLKQTAGRIDFTGDDLYTGLARKLGLIDRTADIHDHPQVIDLSHIHHKLHAACAFYRSGFEDAVSVIVDGAGTFIDMAINDRPETVWELESIFDCKYPVSFKTLYKHLGGRGPFGGLHIKDMDASREGDYGTYELILDDSAGITKAYEAVTQYCGWAPIEAGKTMGLFPYGNPSDRIPLIYTDGGGGDWITADRNIIIPTYPNGAWVNEGRYEYLQLSEEELNDEPDITKHQNRRDMAYAVQKGSQEQVAKLIEKAVTISGKKNVVLSGGYALNCVANYFYLDRLKDLDINLHVEPISSDAGTAIGAALIGYYSTVETPEIKIPDSTLYLGPIYQYTTEYISKIAKKYNGQIKNNVSNKDIVDLLMDTNIVTIFQGRSENGPRALGNRSILFDPRFPLGKDFVNRVKHREYFRPFAGSVMQEHVHSWFDLRGMDESPFMMYAVNCIPGVEEKIPSIIHVDGTCRIQTVTREQNKHYHELIEEFYQHTGVPILFNTSFNLGGEPLVETLDDAVRTLANSEIEYLYLPEYECLIEVKND